MKGIFKPIFEWAVDQYQLFENPIHDYIVMAVILFIGYKIAFSFVGDLYNIDLIDGRAVGSVIHWIVRFVVVTVLFFTVSGIIWLAKAVVSLPWWFWVGVGIAFLLIMIALIIYRAKIQR